MIADDRPDMFGRTMADLVAEGNAQYPLRAVQFAMADYTRPWPGFTDGSRWNGFLNVWVTPAVWDAITAYWHDGHGGAAGNFWVEGCALCPPDDGATLTPADVEDREVAMLAQRPLSADDGAYAGLVGAMAYGWANTEWEGN